MNKSIFRSSFVLLNTDFVKLDHNWDYKNITSTFYRMYFIDEGKGTVYNSAERVDLEAGFIYLIPSFTTCNYFCEQYLSQYYISFIEESADGYSLFSANRKLFKLPAVAQDRVNFQRILALNPNRALTFSYDPQVYEKEFVLRSYHELNNLMHASSFLETSGILLQLISRFLAPEVFAGHARQHIHSKISDAIDYIQTHLEETLTVKKLAGRAAHSTDYFSRLFIENTGQRPLSFIQSKRIERAQLLLSSTNLPFNQIAQMTGFVSVSYFSRVFRQVTGQTPGTYKRAALNLNNETEHKSAWKAENEG